MRRKESSRNGQVEALPRARTAIRLLVDFLRIGLCSFGGGTGVAALLEYELVRRWRVMKLHEFAEIYSLGRAVPGAIGPNLACVYGWVLCGLPGALAAVAGICLPSLLVSLPLTVFLLDFCSKSHLLEASLTTLRPAVIGIVVSVMGRLLTVTVNSSWTWGLTLVLTFGAFVWHLSAPVLVLVAVGAGVGYALWENRSGRGGR